MASKYELVHGYIRLAGYTLDEVAIELNVTRRTLDSKINGSSDFTLSEARKIKSLIGRSIDEIFVVKEDAQPQQIAAETEEIPKQVLENI